MLAALDKIPLSRRAVVAQQVMRHLRPSPLGDDEHAPNDSPELPALLSEAESLLQDPKRGGRVWERLTRAMSSAVSAERERAALARLVRRGLITLSGMPVLFRSGQYRRFAGLVRRAHIERAVRHSDRHEVFGSERGFAVFLHEWREGQLLLVGTTIVPTGLVFEWAWRLPGRAEDGNALAALRRVVDIAGVPFSVNGAAPVRFIEREVVSTPDKSILVEVLPHFPPFFFTSFHVRGTPLHLTELNLGFVIDLERYATFAAPFLGGIHEARRRLLIQPGATEVAETRMRGWLH